MSTKKLTIFASVSLLLLAGCGRNYHGVYRGKESLNQSGMQPVISDITMTLNESNDSVSGTWQSSRGDSGTITGTSTRDGMTNVTLTVATSSLMGGWIGTANCTQTFTGTLTSPNGNQLTGILVSNGSGCYYGSQGTSRSIDVSK